MLKNQGTRRHLIEFWMIEPEITFTHQEESLEVQEQYVAFLVQNVLDHCEYALDVLGQRQRSLRNPIQNCHSLVLPTLMQSNY